MLVGFKHDGHSGIELCVQVVDGLMWDGRACGLATCILCESICSVEQIFVACRWSTASCVGQCQRTCSVFEAFAKSGTIVLAIEGVLSARICKRHVV